MKNKNAVAIMIIAMLVSTCLVACGHEHSWVDATCIAPKTCSECGETEGETVEHTWINATCTEPKTCSVCGTTEGEALGHDVSEITCTESATCNRCGETINPSGHTWIDATCTEPKTCNVCGTTEGEALGHDTDNGVCSRCGLEMYQTVNGSGDDVVQGITTGDGIYRIHFTNAGQHNFIVKSYDSSSSTDLLVNEIGNYDGYQFLEGTSPFSFEISSDGNWSYTIERIGVTSEEAFSGSGCYVTEMFTATSGAWYFTHDGSSNFVVKALTTDGFDLLVNEIGVYSGKKMLNVPSGSNVLLIVEADGNWTANPE